MRTKIKKKKIALIVSSLTAGGAERNAINLALGLSQKYKVDIFSLKKINDYTHEYKQSLRKIKIYSLVNPALPFAITLPTLFYKLFIILNKEQYALLIGGHEYNTFYITVLFSKLFRLKSILIMGNNLKEDILTKSLPERLIHPIMCILSFRLCDKLICVSKGLARQAIEEYGTESQKVEMVYNGVDVKTIKIKSREKNNLNIGKGPVISVFGRLTEKKGHNLLIKAFSFMKKELPELKLLVIGKGNLEWKIKQQIKSLKLDQDVKFTGFIKENPYKYLRMSDLFVFPSLYEGFGNVLIEAMASGTPVVAFDCPFGPREIVRKDSNFKPVKKMEFSDYGVLIPQKSAKLMSEAVIKLIENKDKLRNYRRTGLKRSEDFTIDKMVRAHLRLLDDLFKHV